MIPIRDTIRSKNYPVINNALIFINVIAFIIEMGNLDQFVLMYGFIPARYTVPEIASYFTFSQQLFPLISFMFLHGGFWHLVGNMWFLYIFGDNIEDRLGHIRYLLFYLLCGWTSAIIHLVFNWHSQIPTVGASGAIAGIMGAYFILYPRSRILTLIPIIIIPFFFEIPAAFFLGVWILFQLLSAAIIDPHAGGIAWWAHIGGFASGIIFLWIFLSIPRSGMTEKVQRVTKKKKTPRLHRIKPADCDDACNLYGIISITTQEAERGTRKMINITQESQKKLFQLNIVPGTINGTTLRMAGIGKKKVNKERGDVFLKVNIEDPHNKLWGISDC